MDLLTRQAEPGTGTEGSRPIRILLVENNHEEALMLRALAHDAGEDLIEVEWTDYLAEGLSLLDADHFDVLLLSLALYEGPETLSGIRTQAERIPLILLGRQKDELKALQAIQIGAQDFLPIDHLDGCNFIRSLRFAMERQQIMHTMERSRTIERYLAYHDTLTKLPNRHLFHDRLVQSIAYSRRNETSVAVLFIDLDGFKQVNDSMGHSAGDLLLMSFADRLKACIRESETASRFGGDEFAVILSDIEGDHDAAIVAQRILESCKYPHMIADQECFIGTSIGISMYPSDGTNSETLVRNADTAMYLAKQDGGYQYLFYAPSMKKGMPEEPAHEKNIRKALENEELLLYFQPQLDLHSGKITSVEALVRWRHPKYGIIPPEQFIPAAEKSGLIVPIGEFVLRRACEQNRTWQEKGFSAIRVAVNLSMRQLKHRSLLMQVNDVLAQTEMDPQFLGLEITENSAIHRCDETVHLLESLKNRGIEISIDDFGIGYSSLGYLKRLPVQMLKIDRSFVVNMTQDSEDVAIIRAIIAMAHSLGIRVTAEGVESDEQLTILRSLGCDAIQGYHFSRPVSADIIEGLLHQFN
jgi:diguanylate cyclase (GGDEF)-like protein